MTNGTLKPTTAASDWNNAAEDIIAMNPAIAAKLKTDTTVRSLEYSLFFIFITQRQGFY